MAVGQSAKRIPGKPRRRLSFARIPEIMEMPYLLETQKESYREFLQFETPRTFGKTKACKKPSAVSFRLPRRAILPLLNSSSIPSDSRSIP
jgi:DNA-directed RNA polymerase beta subunit